MLYDNVKDIDTLKYPASTHGNIKFNIAGERIVQQGKNQTTVSNNFKIKYVPEISVKDDLIDNIFHFRPSKAAIEKLEKNTAKLHEKSLLVSNTDTLAFYLIF